jgi:hypothetical protein
MLRGAEGWRLRAEKSRNDQKWFSMVLFFGFESNIGRNRHDITYDNAKFS